MALINAKGGKSEGDSSGKLPERNYAEERLRHAARLVKAVHEHDVEGADDAMRAHHAVCSDEDEAME